VGLILQKQDFYEVYFGPSLLGWFDATAPLFVTDKCPRGTPVYTRPGVPKVRPGPAFALETPLRPGWGNCQGSPYGFRYATALTVVPSRP
jgi:hypothetical protein